MKSNEFVVDCLFSQISEVLLNTELDDKQKVQLIKMILEC